MNYCKSTGTQAAGEDADGEIDADFEPLNRE